MIDTTTIPRDFSRNDWRNLYRILRKCGERGSIADESLLAERAVLRSVLDERIEDDCICEVTAGMDCDCCQYVYARIVRSPTVMKLMHDADDAYRWADGPMSIGYCKPSERPSNCSRDLALEAFENGHAHAVSTIDYYND